MAVVVVEAAAVVVVDSSAVDFAVVGFAYPVVDFAYRVVAFDFVSPSGPDPFGLVAFDYGDQLHFDLHLDLSCLDPFGLDQVLVVVPCQAWAELQEAHLVAVAAQVDLGDLQGDLQDLEV